MIERLHAPANKPFHGLCFEGNDPYAKVQVRLFGKLACRIHLNHLAVVCDWPARVQWRIDFRHHAPGRPAMACLTGRRRLFLSHQEWLPFRRFQSAHRNQALPVGRSRAIQVPSSSRQSGCSIGLVIADCIHGLVRTQRKMIYAVGNCPTVRDEGWSAPRSNSLPCPTPGNSATS